MRTCGGSLSFRLSEIESAIPYADVKKAFRSTRDKWLRATIDHQQSAHRLAELTLELIDAFTSACIAFLWPDDAKGFAQLRELCVRIPTATSPKQGNAYKQLKEVRAGKPSMHPSRKEE